MIIRICLKDKSSILVDGDMDNINDQATNKQFIKVVNHKTGKDELYNKDHIWCVRQSSQE